MTTKRAKTKSSLKSNKKINHERDGSPFVHVAAPSHRIPGQPLGFNPIQNRTTYDPTFHPGDFVKHCQEGASRAEVAASWGISKNTLSNWCEQHEDMRKAYEIGMAAQQAWLMRKIRNNLDNRGANSVLLIFSAKNLLGWGDEAKTDFEDVQDVELDIRAYPRAK